MRALFVAHTGELGGAELALLTYLRRLPPDIEARVLLLAPGPLEDLLRGLGIPVAVTGLQGRPGVRRAGAFQRDFARELRRRPVDVVHATGVKAATLCAPAGRALGVPVVWHKVDLTYDRRLTAPLSRLCAAVIPVSEAAGAAVAASRRLEPVTTPVRLDEGFRVTEDRPPATLGSLGRLVPYKGHHHVIEAAGRLRRDFEAVRVIVAGAPAREAPGYPDELMAVARRSGMEDRVELTGHVDTVEDVLERLTILVNATYRDERGVGFEGLGAAIVEASWSGLPVVATGAGGAVEAVLDGRTGRLVPPADPRALADAVARYLANPAAARSAGRAGSEFARERFRPDALAPRLFASLRAVGQDARAAPLGG